MKVDFDIDTYLNPLIPPPWLHTLPPWLSWFLGYRRKAGRKISTEEVWLWTFIGAFCGVSVVQAVFERSEYFLERGVVNIVGAFGATAVLLFGVIEAPFAQPRAIFFGHTISALVGVSITKLFLHLSPASFQDHLWLAGSLSCALASTAMAMTKTIHPPSGGTALIAATQVDIRALGWYYIPVVMLSSVLMIGVGLITNNLRRVYPIYWWTSVPLKAKQPEKQEGGEKLDGGGGRLELSDSGMTKVTEEREKGEQAVVVGVEGVTVPAFLRLSYDQRAVLDEIQAKIKDYYIIGENED